MKERKLTPILVSALVTLILFWSALDFSLFIAGLRSTKSTGIPVSAKPDAVVALTGGNGLRIALAVAYARSRGLPTLITGVHPDATEADISAMSGVDVEFLNCCVDIDRLARDTVGNGRQIALWARKNGYLSLVVVTSDYHVQRALIEARIAMPEASFVSIATRSEQLYYQHWWLNRDTLLLLIKEWMKLRISSLKNALVFLFLYIKNEQ